ncbi:hypothetical protein Pfo_014308 [Paulownia fortunei]|nr:hypothetical protein Pfo_014308 [Paulownia fortunei]
MAISHTMSNPSDWLLQPYQTDFSNINQTEIPPTILGGAATTTAASRNNNLSPDQGRITKPLRRRSRASRRTPTTLLNTDTTNFRAMVQRFTGGPTIPFASRSQIPNGGATLNFMEHIATTTNAAAAPASGFHMQYPNQLQQQQQHMFIIDSMHGGGGRGGLSPQVAPPPPGSSSGNENRNYDNYML